MKKCNPKIVYSDANSLGFWFGFKGLLCFCYCVFVCERKSLFSLWPISSQSQKYLLVFFRNLSLSLYLYNFFNFLRYYNIEFVCTYVYITIDICCFYFLGLVIVGIWSLKMEWNWVPLTKDYSLWRCYQSSIAWFRGGY